MSLIFKPTGSLDVSSDPSVLPQVASQNTLLSGEMVRCKNLILTENGIAQTRYGSSKFNAVAINACYNLIEQAGTRYALGASIYADESQISVSSTLQLSWSSILYNPYNSTTQNVYALNGTDRKRIENDTIYEWGITAPTVAPTIAVGALTGMTGDYNAKYSYCRKEGTTIVSESNLSPAAAAAVTLANESLDITWTASTDAQVTHVRVYRTLAGGSTYYHDQDVAIGTTTLDTNTADGSLGDLEVTTHTRPPLGSAVIGPNYNGICFILKDNLVYYCLAKQPDYWPATYFIEACSIQYSLKAGTIYNGQLYVANSAQIIHVAGSGVETFFPISQEANGGTLSRYAFCAVKGFGIFHVLNDGIYLFSTGGDSKITYGKFDKIFRGEASGNMPAVGDLTYSWMIAYENRLYFGYPSSGSTYCANVIVINLTDLKATYYSYGFDITCVAIDYYNKRLICADTSGFIRQLEDPDQTDDSGTAIAWDIQSKDFTLSTRAHFPRWVKYDVDASSAVSATGSILLDGSSIQTHALTANRDTKRRLMVCDNGERCALRVYGSGAVSIYAVESE